MAQKQRVWETNQWQTSSFTTAILRNKMLRLSAPLPAGKRGLRKDARAIPFCYHWAEHCCRCFCCCCCYCCLWSMGCWCY